MTHLCVGNLTIVGSDNGLSPGRRKAIIWTNAGILSIAPYKQGNFCRNRHIFILKNAFQNVIWEMTAILSRPQCVKTSFLICVNICSLAVFKVWVGTSCKFSEWFITKIIYMYYIDFCTTMYWSCQYDVHFTRMISYHTKNFVIILTPVFSQRTYPFRPEKAIKPPLSLLRSQHVNCSK